MIVLKGINLSLLARKGQSIPNLCLLGDNPSRVKTISLEDCIFMDSYKLFESSLADLCKLKSTEEESSTEKMVSTYLSNHEHFSTVYTNMGDEDKGRLMVLLNGKGYFCYDYMTHRDALKEKSLPPLEQFRNQLNSEEPSEVRYGEAVEIWDLLQCRTIDDYNCIYNVMDTINLAVIMEERTKTLKEYLYLDPRHFTSMSVYGAACAKFKTRSIVDCIPNERIMEAIEEGTHGGFSNVSTRRGISSAFYDEPMYIRDGDEVVRVMSTVEALDENNQYGGQICQNLSRGGWRLRKGTPQCSYVNARPSLKSTAKRTRLGTTLRSACSCPTSDILVGRKLILLFFYFFLFHLFNVGNTKIVYNNNNNKNTNIIKIN